MQALAAGCSAGNFLTANGSAFAGQRPNKRSIDRAAADRLQIDANKVLISVHLQPLRHSFVNHALFARRLAKADAFAVLKTLA